VSGLSEALLLDHAATGLPRDSPRAALRVRNERLAAPGPVT